MVYSEDVLLDLSWYNPGFGGESVRTLALTPKSGTHFRGLS